MPASAALLLSLALMVPWFGQVVHMWLCVVRDGEGRRFAWFYSAGFVLACVPVAWLVREVCG